MSERIGERVGNEPVPPVMACAPNLTAGIGGSHDNVKPATSGRQGPPC